MINPIHPAESGKFNVAPEAIDAGLERVSCIDSSVKNINEVCARLFPVAVKSEAELTKRMPTNYVMPFSVQPPVDYQYSNIEAPQEIPKQEHENKAAIEQAYAALAAAQEMSAPQSFEDLQVK